MILFVQRGFQSPAAAALVAPAVSTSAPLEIIPPSEVFSPSVLQAIELGSSRLDEAKPLGDGVVWKHLLVELVRQGGSLRLWATSTPVDVRRFFGSDMSPRNTAIILRSLRGQILPGELASFWALSALPPRFLLSIIRS